MPVSFEPLLVHLPAWLMVLFRLAGIFVLAPMFGGAVIPTRVKVFLALGLSFCVYPMLLMPVAGHPSVAVASITAILDHGLSMWALPAAVGREMLIGLLIGYGASLPLIGMQLSGRVIDQQLGMGLAGIYNPELDEQAGVVGEFYYLFALTVFLVVGGHRVLLTALVDSFQSVPLGGFTYDGQALTMIVGLINSAFILALKVASPLLCLIFLETVAMGFVARTVPQMNILSIGFPLRILVGVALLVGLVAVQADVLVAAIASALRNVTMLLHG